MRHLAGLTLACMFMLLLGSDALASARRQLNLATTEYPPFYGKQLKEQGVVTDVTLTALRRMGYSIHLESYPFARAVLMVQSGQLDGIVGLWYRHSRKQWVEYSSPILSHQLVLYKRKARSIEFDRLSQLGKLSPYTIGTGRGYANPQAFQYAKLRTEEGSTDSINLKKLYHGRVDLVLISQDVAQYLIETGPAEYAAELEQLGPAIGWEQFHFGMSRKMSHYRQVIDDFNLGLEQLRQDGTLEQILRSHGF